MMGNSEAEADGLLSVRNANAVVVERMSMSRAGLCGYLKEVRKRRAAGG